jgi:hypothetical protein
MYSYSQPNVDRILLSKMRITLAQQGNLIVATQQMAQVTPVCQIANIEVR